MSSDFLEKIVLFMITGTFGIALWVLKGQFREVLEKIKNFVPKDDLKNIDTKIDSFISEHNVEHKELNASLYERFDKFSSSFHEVKGNQCALMVEVTLIKETLISDVRLLKDMLTRILEKK
jgi:hypothetical protein